MLLWSLCPQSSSRNFVSEAGERLGATGRQHWTSGRGTAAWRGIQDISVWISYHPILLRLPDPGPIILHHPLRRSHIVDGLWLLFEVYHMMFWLIFLLAQEHLGPVHRRWSLEQTGDWLRSVFRFFGSSAIHKFNRWKPFFKSVHQATSRFC